MKYFIYFILILLQACSGQNVEKTVAASEGIAKKPDASALQKEAASFLKESPKKASAIYEKIIAENANEENMDKVASSYMNLANLYDEKFNNLDSAKIYANLSLKTWENLKDTSNITLLLNYGASLYARTEDYAIAEQYYFQALDLYNTLEFKPGAALTNLQLAKCVLADKRAIESLEFFKKAKNYWNEKENKSKLFSANLLGIEILNQLGDRKGLQQLIAENNTIAKESKLNAFQKNEFKNLLDSLN